MADAGVEVLILRPSPDARQRLQQNQPLRNPARG